MDWYLEPGAAGALHRLRLEIRAFLDRHAERPGDTADAELIVEELVGNALRHGGGPVWVQLTWTEDHPVLVVSDLGPGFTLPDADAMPWLADLDAVPDLAAEGGRGLFLVTHLAGELDIAARRGGGSQVTARLPVRRAASASYDPPAGGIGVLPSLDEAMPQGGFSRESFLRALVVQLSQTVERMHGPGAAEAAVAQVGIDVGGQMELEYRLAADIVDRLTPDQLATCFLRLKHAIDGGFYVVEISEDRIVLGNTRCPFGDAVRRAPALCRMTSSVFGGIAARNQDDGAAIVLEERIAVGDPGCRVVVHLGAVPAAASRFAHRYGSPNVVPAP